MYCELKLRIFRFLSGQDSSLAPPAILPSTPPPIWWAFLTTKKDCGYTLINLANGILDMAPGLGWADAKTLDASAGGSGDSPTVLEALDSWKGKLGVTVNLPGGLDDVKKEQVMVNYELLGGVVGWKATCLPRGGKFFLTVSASPKVSAPQGSVSKDGNTYEVVLPTLVGITSGQLEEIFKKGMK